VSVEIALVCLISSPEKPLVSPEKPLVRQDIGRPGEPAPHGDGDLGLY